MQNYVEQEGGIGFEPAATGGVVQGPSEGQSVERWALGVAGTLIVGLAGWIYKTRRSGQALEDTTNQATVVTIQGQQARILELENKISDLLQQTIKSNQDLLDAQRNANNAVIQADNALAAANVAQAAAATAQAAAATARNEAENLSAKVARQAAYIRTLKSMLIEANITPPEEPT